MKLTSNKDFSCTFRAQMPLKSLLISQIKYHRGKSICLNRPSRALRGKALQIPAHSISTRQSSTLSRFLTPPRLEPQQKLGLLASLPYISHNGILTEQLNTGDSANSPAPVGFPNQLLKALNQFQEVQEKTLVKEPTDELA